MGQFTQFRNHVIEAQALTLSAEGNVEPILRISTLPSDTVLPLILRR